MMRSPDKTTLSVVSLLQQMIVMSPPPAAPAVAPGSSCCCQTRPPPPSVARCRCRCCPAQLVPVLDTVSGQPGASGHGAAGQETLRSAPRGEGDRCWSRRRQGAGAVKETLRRSDTVWLKIVLVNLK